MPYGITRPQWVDTFQSEQNGHLFDDIFRCIFLKKKSDVYSNFKLQFVLMGQIGNESTFIQVFGLGLVQAKSYYLDQYWLRCFDAIRGE